MDTIKYPGQYPKRLKRAAIRCMHDLLYDEPDLPATRLAEETAWAMEHDDWLDDPTHWIWDFAAVLTTPEPTPGA